MNILEIEYSTAEFIHNYDYHSLCDPIFQGQTSTDENGIYIMYFTDIQGTLYYTINSL